MTALRGTYRSELDFDTRDMVGAHLEHQGVKLRHRFDAGSYAVLAAAMSAHDVGRERGGTVEVLRSLAGERVRLSGVGITGDVLFGPQQVRALVEAATAAGVEAAYHEIRSAKRHDAFLVEWDQLAGMLARALGAGTGKPLAASASVTRDAGVRSRRSATAPQPKWHPRGADASPPRPYAPGHESRSHRSGPCPLCVLGAGGTAGPHHMRRLWMSPRAARR